MRFACLGSCIGGDIVFKAKGQGWINVSNNVSYSCLAFVDQELTQELKKKMENEWDELLEFSDEADTNRNMLYKAVTSDICVNINKSNPDYVLVDLADFRIGEYVFDLGEYGRVAFGTNLLKKENAEILAKRLEETLQRNISFHIVTIDGLSDIVLERYIKMHIDNLISNYGREKIIFFQPRLVCNYLDGGIIKYTSQFYIQGNTNDTLNRIYNIASEYITYIEAPDYLIGDKDCLKPFEWHFCTPYYDYMIECIEHVIGGGNVDDEYIREMKTKAEKEIYALYNRVFCQQIINRLNKKGLLMKRIVLLAKDQQFDQMLDEQHLPRITDYIHYDRNSNLESIKNRISILKSIDDENKEEMIFVIPEIFNHKDDGIYSVFFDNALTENVDYFRYYPSFPIVEEKFCGSFFDVFDNEVRSKGSIKLSINGVGNKIIYDHKKGGSTIRAFTGTNILVNDSEKSFSLIITAYPDFKMIWGKDNSVVDKIKIIGTFATILTVGEDNMFSWDCIIYVGDGHSIFKKKENAWIRTSGLHNKIAIGNHNWFGFETRILAGTEMSDGCVIGTGSLINKYLPNNVVAAGRPAKVVHKNIAWSRNNLCKELWQDKYVLERFTDLTNLE